MPARRSGLGRGLGALIPTEVTHAQGSLLREIPLAQIRPNQFQPRKRFDEAALASLVDSIRAVGVLQPILVRSVGQDQYELIAGERRFRAAHRAGLPAIPALVHAATDTASLEQALVENLHREDLNPLDEAAAYQQLIDDFQFTHEDLAQRLGRSRTVITNSLRLFQLPPGVQRLVQDGDLSAGHARALLVTPDRELQEKLAQEAIHQALSVRALEALVRERSGERIDLDEPDVTASAPPETRASSTPPRGLRPPGVLELEELLSLHLNTRVGVEMRAKRGRVVIEFATIEDLERIYRLMIGEASS